MTSTELFFGLSQFTDQNGGLANRTKLTNTAKNIDPKLTRQGGFLNFTFSRDMAMKKGEKANTLRNT